MQIVVAPPYETCISLHDDDAAAMRVKKVVRHNAQGRGNGAKDGTTMPCCFAWHALYLIARCAELSAVVSLVPLVFSSPTFLSLPLGLQLDAERQRLQAG